MSQRLRHSKITNFKLCGNCFKRLSLKTYKQHRRLYCLLGIWCNVSQLQKHNEDDRFSINLFDSSGDNPVKETELCYEKDCSSVDPSTILDNLMEIVNSLKTENDVWKDELELYDVNGMSHTQWLHIEIFKLGCLFITDIEVLVESSNELEREFPEFIETLNNCEDNTLHLDKDDEALIWWTIGFILALKSVYSLSSKAIGFWVFFLCYFTLVDFTVIDYIEDII